MDSLSQLVLGAATGEAVLGRKLGNRALWLGAVGGTIPDLDVLGGLWLDPLENLAFQLLNSQNDDQHNQGNERSLIDQGHQNGQGGCNGSSHDRNKSTQEHCDRDGDD